jgi:hypothetical protein
VSRVAERLAVALAPLHRAVRRAAVRVPAVEVMPVPVTVRCAACGTTVMRFDPKGPGRAFSRSLAAETPSGDVVCPTHGPLRWGGNWGAEWERRGRPPRLNLKYPPAC